ncbi:class I mannose-6-phosphate isomerase [Mucilaginibacter agri]|uniref:Mannose-6-phosphate isomerase n=1 Tax=Mucilaginibacter agri TaxID=2695265 RepID=A0A965ZM12_9SPHI|nr:class I mannose-6-phosphate isomerase [Mucilaginibacter agri]NCD72522.1 mannose-6-phosphate isomerase [Mucilaginibacter agri]
MAHFFSNYDKLPAIAVGHAQDAWTGWEDIAKTIGTHGGPDKSKVVALECYTGLYDEEIITELESRLGVTFFRTTDYMRSESEIDRLVFPDVTDDEIFGYITRLTLLDFFDPEKLSAFQYKLNGAEGAMYIYGPGATLIAPNADLLVYFDMPRWEGQLRQRRNEVDNLGVNNSSLKASLQYKRAFFVDWRVCDKHKRTLMHHWDYVVDTTQANNPKMVSGKALNNALEQVVSRPFRVVPFFDPGPWGGQWMKKYCDLDPSQINYAWCFDCVPEENSMLLQFGDVLFETPAINLVFTQSKKLLGRAVEARFGGEFPIRFDFLDTIEGGNLSLQVHPTNEYIHEHFGMAYTQDESYYMLDTEPDACVYLGLNNNVDSEEMIKALKDANKGDGGFDAEKYVGKYPVKKHDHVLIPAGTIHCSGKNSMVLEISATPYIFTFKLWDWGRMGLDGKPRPINIGHGKKVINWDVTPEVVERELINAIKPISQGEGWREERTGLHETEFIETRRHWFTGKVHHHTNGSVNVLNLVEGREVIVESPNNTFEPYIVHYAETFIVPEHVGEYTIRPYGESEEKECATLKAFVRFNA